MAANLSEVILVLGNKSDEIINCISKLSCDYEKLKIVINKDYGEGMSSSIRAEISAASKELTTVAIFLGDQPFIGPNLIKMLARYFETSEKGIMVKVNKKGPSHPVFFI